MDRFICEMFHVSLMVTTSKKPRVDSQKKKEGKQSTPKWKITNLQRQAETEGKKNSANIKQPESNQ